MGSGDGATSRKRVQGQASNKRPKSVTDALREEAERGWAQSDRKTAKGRRRTGAKRSGGAR